jgi:hypothetical protein
MDQVTATANYALLKTLPPNTKICINAENGRMSLDTRWFNSTRRYLTGDSRRDLAGPMQQTFEVMQSTIPMSELLETLRHTHLTLRELYGHRADAHRAVALALAGGARASVPEIDELFQGILTKLEKQQAASTPLPPSPLSTSPVLPPAPPTPPQSSTVVRRKNNHQQDDIRIEMDIKSLTEETTTFENEECGLYEVFPCLRRLANWLKEKFA